MIIYHNPRCRKSRAGLEYLEQKTSEVEIIKYLDKGFSAEELTELIEKLKLPVEDIIRKQEDYYKKELRGKNFTREEWIKIIAENPRLLQRPIVVKGNRAVLANPAENIDKLL